MSGRAPFALLAVAAALGLAAIPASGVGAGGRAEFAGERAAGASWHPRVAAAKRFARGRDGEVSFAIIGLDRQISRLHANRSTPMMSVFKAMLLAAYLSTPAVRHRRLRPADRFLLGPMIRRSDNGAATRVRDIVGREAIEDLARKAGMRDFQYQSVWGLSRSSPRDQARFMLRFDRFVPDRHQPYARRLLGDIVPSQRWGVGKVDLHGWKLRFKGGWGAGTGEFDHQVAFLDRGGERIALAIFTEQSPGHDYAKHTLEGVARRLLHGLPRL